MEFNSLATGLKIFMSRAVSGKEGEDLVEKQYAEQGLMPVLEDETGVYGYTEENRHMVECFRKGETPLETFSDGLAVVEILIDLYRSAEIGETVRFPRPGTGTLRVCGRRPTGLTKQPVGPVGVSGSPDKQKAAMNETPSILVLGNANGDLVLWARSTAGRRSVPKSWSSAAKRGPAVRPATARLPLPGWASTTASSPPRATTRTGRGCAENSLRLPASGSWTNVLRRSPLASSTGAVTGPSSRRPAIPHRPLDIGRSQAQLKHRL